MRNAARGVSCRVSRRYMVVFACVWPNRIASCGAQELAKAGADDLRKMTLSTQMLILRSSMESGQLDGAGYVTNLGSRISRDVHLAKYLVATDRRAEAVRNSSSSWCARRTAFFFALVGRACGLLTPQLIIFL